MLYQLYLYGKNIQYNIWYSNPLLLTAAVPLMVLMLRYPIKSEQVQKAAKYIAKCSFGIFLVHYLVIFAIRDKVEIVRLLPVRCALYFVIASLGSFAIVAVLGKNKIFGKWLFFMK